MSKVKGKRIKGRRDVVLADTLNLIELLKRRGQSALPAWERSEYKLDQSKDPLALVVVKTALHDIKVRRLLKIRKRIRTFLWVAIMTEYDAFDLSTLSKKAFNRVMGA